jgi:hypothetical protein
MENTVNWFLMVLFCVAEIDGFNNTFFCVLVILILPRKGMNMESDMIEEANKKLTTIQSNFNSFQ